MHLYLHISDTPPFGDFVETLRLDLKFERQLLV